MKTVFAALAQIPSAWLNALSNHTHDGLDQDGSCPPIPSSNLLIGGNFSVNPYQRGSASLAVTASGSYVADRFRVEFDGAPTITRDVVDLTVGSRLLGITARKGLKLTLTNKGGATYIRLGQRMESVATLAGASAVLSTAIQGNKALTIPTRVVQYFGSGGAPSASVITPGDPLAVTAALQELYGDFSVPGITGKTLGSTSGTDYLELQYDLSAMATGDYVIIPLTRLQRGSYPTAEEEADPGRTLLACMRYGEALTITADYVDTLSATYLLRTYSYKAKKRLAVPATTTVVPITYYSGATPGTTIPTLTLTAGDSALQVQAQGLTTGRGINNGSVFIDAEL